MQHRAALLLLIPALFAQTSPVRIAGLDPHSNAIGDGGPALQGRLGNPVSIAVDGPGNVYIADLSFSRIRHVTPDGNITTVAGTGDYGSGPDGAPAAATAISPYGIAVDSHHIVYFTDGASLVRKIALDGTLQTVAGFLGTGPDGGDGGKATSARIHPSGIAVDSSGNLFIAEPAFFRVRKVGSDGIIHIVAGNGLSGNEGEGGPALNAQLLNPSRVAVDARGNLYIADGQAGNRILKVTPAGVLTRIAGGGTSRLDEVAATASYVSSYGGIAPDAAGDLYLADWSGNVIRKVTTDGIIHTIAGSGKPGVADGCGSALSAQFSAPQDVAVDPAGNVYVVDGGTRLRQISAQGSIRTLAGAGPSRFSGDNGPATSAAISSPAGLAFDTAGNLYLADSGNARIRRITPEGIITTVAGANNSLAGDYSGCAPAPPSLRNPTALAVDANGTLYIADTGNNRVLAMSPGGQLTTVAESGLAAPAGLAVDLGGHLYIADTQNNRLLVLTTGGSLTTVASDLSAPTGLAFDHDGNLYIAESKAYRVVRRKADGVMEPFAGTGFNTRSVAPVPAPPAELGILAALTSDPFNSIHVADLGGKLQRITRNCAVSNLSNNPTAGVASDAQGNIYFSEPLSNVVWKLPAVVPPSIEAATPALAYSAFVNAASLLTAPGTSFNSPLLPLFLTYGAAPGEIVRIRGVCLGPFETVPAEFDSSGTLPTVLAGSSVLFDTTPAPLLSVQAGEIWAITPSSIASQKDAKLTVESNGGRVQANIVAKAAEPGIFTRNGSGIGQAVANNDDNSPNSEENPAARGSILAFWATGQGTAVSPLADGQSAPSSPLARPSLPITVTIGGQAAEVIDAALSPGLVGVLQVNVRIPAQIQPGSTSLTLTVGGISRNDRPTNPYDSWQSVTIAVK